MLLSLLDEKILTFCTMALKTSESLSIAVLLLVFIKILVDGLLPPPPMLYAGPCVLICIQLCRRRRKSNIQMLLYSFEMRVANPIFELRSLFIV